MTRYVSRVAVYDAVNEAVCDCISWDGSSYSTCEEYVASTAGAEKCGYSEYYDAYLKRNVFWPDVEDYISLVFQVTLAKSVALNAIELVAPAISTPTVRYTRVSLKGLSLELPLGWSWLNCF